jgi:ribosomal protein S18 acetylase RimI-like enzyme
VAHALARPELCRYFLAEQDAHVIGQVMITYEWSDWRDATFWWLQSVYVRTEHRRCGVFRALYRHVEKLAERTPGVCGLRLYVDRDNDRAASTYRGLGMSDSRYVVYQADWSGIG